MDEIHLTKKDFKIEWYSGSGAGGQHRNAHQNCCRIIHIETGLQAIGTASRSRTTNQKIAFETLARRIITHHYDLKVLQTNKEVIRNYNAVRNVVHDKASGLKKSYKDVVLDADLSDMIEARVLKVSL